MKKSKNSSGQPSEFNKQPEDPKFEKRTNLMLAKLEQKKDEIDKSVFQVLREALVNDYKATDIPRPRAERKSKFDKRTNHILEIIKKKRENDEIDDKMKKFLEDSL